MVFEPVNVNILSAVKEGNLVSVVHVASAVSVNDVAN